MLTFPDGRLPRCRWRWVTRAAVAVYAVMLAPALLETSFAEDPGNTGFLDARPDLGVVSDIADVVFDVTLGLNLLVLVACCGAFVARLQRAVGDERRQLVWLAYAFVVVAVSLPLSLLVVGDGRLVVVTLPLIPIAAAVAVFRFRLYDLDVVVNRSLVYATLSTVLLATYLLAAWRARWRWSPTRSRSVALWSGRVSAWCAPGRRSAAGCAASCTTAWAPT